MRRFELILTLGSLVAVAWPAIFGVRPRRGIVAASLVALLIAHLRFEGFRWQMVPLYGTTLGLAIGDTLAVERRLEWFRRIARGLFGLAGIGLAAALPVVLPVPHLPTPSGPEAIGTVTLELVDLERVEEYGEAPDGPRRLVVQVWYPAQPAGSAVPIPYHPDVEVIAPAVSRRLGLPFWFLDHTRYSESHGFVSLPVRSGAFPVVLYSHGWTGFRSSALTQIETLVSHGYMVVSPDHTHAAVATRFSDGDVIPYDPAALPDVEEVEEEDYQQAAAQLIGVLADDLVTIVDALETGDTGPFGSLASSADVGSIGVFGHSAGGGAAVTFCLTDERCDAILGLDPWVEHLPDRVIASTATRPMLFMRSEEWAGNANDAVLRGIAERGESVTYWVGVTGAEHNDFTVLPLLSPIAGDIGLRGSIPAGRLLPIVDRYLVGFFDRFLLETGSAALETTSFPEVSIEVIRPG